MLTYLNNDTITRLGNEINLCLHYKDKLEAKKYLARLKTHWVNATENGTLDIEDIEYLYQVFTDQTRDYMSVFGKDEVWANINGQWELR